MIHKRKGISTKISEKNQSIIKYCYLNYNSDQVKQIKFVIPLHRMVQKQQVIGTILLKQNQQNNQKQEKYIQIRSTDTGKVIKILNPNLQLLKTENIDSENYNTYTLRSTNNTKTSTIDLFQFQLCDHMPKDQIVQRIIEQQNKQKTQNNGKIKKKQKNQRIFCKQCNQRLHYFYLPQEISIIYKDLYLQFQLQDIDQIRQIQWQVKLNQSITQNTQLAKYQQKEFKINESGKIIQLIEWSCIQKFTNDLIILKYKPLFCQHQKIQQNICQYCYEQIDPIQKNLKKYLFQMQEQDEVKKYMITTGTALQDQQNQFVQKLLQNQKGLLILDLDNTILHAIQLNQINKERLNQMIQYYYIPTNYILNNKMSVSTTYIVKMRPYFQQFIQTVIKYFQIYVYTKGTRTYAQLICNAIRNQYASKDTKTHNTNKNLKYFDFLKDKNAFKINRIITRDQDPDLMKKSIDNILPNRKQNLLILDDLGKIWNFSESLLFTVPYNYFYKISIIKNYQQRKIRIKKITKDQQILNLVVVDQKKQLIDTVVDSNQPILQLPCDHFQRQVQMIQKKHQNQQIQNKTNNITHLVDIQQTPILQDQKCTSDIFPKNDFYLIYAANALCQIHKRFFQKIKQKKIQISNIHIQYRFEFFKGTKVMIFTKNDYAINSLTRLCKKLGCQVINQINNNQKPNLLIRLNSLSVNYQAINKQKIQQKDDIQQKRKENQIQQVKKIKHLTQTLKIPVVSQSWINYCFMYTYNFPYEKFIIEYDKLHLQIDEQEYQWILKQYANKILKDLNVSKLEKINQSVQNQFHQE